MNACLGTTIIFFCKFSYLKVVATLVLGVDLLGIVGLCYEITPIHYHHLI